MSTNTTIAWLALGIALVITEIFTTTFVLLFFGVSALAIALFKFIGLNNIYIELSLFALIGLSGVLLFRKRLLVSITKKSDHPVDGIGQAVFTLDADIPAGGSASVAHLGTTWTAMNPTSENFEKGARVKIERIEGVKLVVSKI